MDDILQRMLAVEKQADEMVKRAEVEAEEILAQSREDVAALEQDTQSRVTAEVDALIEARVAAVEREKGEILAAAEAEFTAREAEFRSRVTEHVGLLTELLAYTRRQR